MFVIVYSDISLFDELDDLGDADDLLEALESAGYVSELLFYLPDLEASPSAKWKRIGSNPVVGIVCTNLHCHRLRFQVTEGPDLDFDIDIPQWSEGVSGSTCTGTAVRRLMCCSLSHGGSILTDV